MEHTQGKWKVTDCAGSISERFDIWSDGANQAETGTIVCGDFSVCFGKEIGKANARHICKCVNSHDALLEACKKALKLIHADTFNISETDSIEQAISEAKNDL